MKSYNLTSYLAIDIGASNGRAMMGTIQDNQLNLEEIHRFQNPTSMIDSIQYYCQTTGQFVPNSIGEIARCIYESLAFRYNQVLQNLRKMANFPIEKLHIIGGGSKNKMLNTFTANATGLPVVAGPCEATSIGNILMQAKAAGLVTEKSEMRQLVRNSVELEIFNLTESALWQSQYKQYLKVYKETI